MDKILNARLVWIHSTEKYITDSATPLKSDNNFIKLINIGDRDEYTSSYYDQIERTEMFSDFIIIDDIELPLTVVKSNYIKYQISLIHIVLEINTELGIGKDNFARLINGSAILNQKLINNKLTLKELIKKNDVLISKGSFLINQIIEAIPNLPKDVETDSDEFISQNIQIITQMLLRSNTAPEGLSPENNRDYLENISSFKGSVDLCSGKTMIQYFFSKIKTLGSSEYIDADRRFSWMCSVITMVNIQSIILKQATNKINELSPMGAKQKMGVTKDLNKVLLELREYWDVDAMIHPMTARKINIYKERMGVANQFNILNVRLESAEHLANRELSEVQNEQDQILNYILLFIAAIQIMPMIFNTMVNWFGSGTFEVKIFNYTSTTFLSIFLPLLILKNRSIRKKMRNLFPIRIKKEV